MTDFYSVTVKESARDQLRKLPRKDIERVDLRIRNLSVNPRPANCERLAGGRGYRVRQGDYRILYTVDDSAKAVDIYRIGHRRELYR